MKVTYYIKKNGKTLGPLENWQVLDLYDKKEISENDKIAAGENVYWDTAAELKDSNLWKTFRDLRAQVESPTGVLFYRLIEETRELKEQTEKVKWACRSVALFLAVIVFFGTKITFNF